MGTLLLTGGSLQSRRLSAPGGRAVRPTPARVKEALFSILGARIVDALFLDLYAGTGAVGFEALSRGARHATFVEAQRAVAGALTHSATALDLMQRCTVIAAPAERAVLRLRQRFDMVFADPPFALAYPAGILSRLRNAGAIDAATLVVYEHSSARAAPVDPEFTVTRTVTYGAVALSFLAAM